MRRRKITVTVIRIFFITAGLFVVFLMLRSFVQTQALRISKIMTTGIVFDTHTNESGICGGVDYTYKVNGKEYKGSAGYCEFSEEVCKTFIGKSFPVIYSPKNYRNSIMLITRERFKYYELEQPDSLKWVEVWLTWK